MNDQNRVLNRQGARELNPQGSRAGQWRFRPHQRHHLGSYWQGWRWSRWVSRSFNAVNPLRPMQGPLEVWAACIDHMKTRREEMNFERLGPVAWT